MTKTTFSDHDIKVGLVEISDDAIAACYRTFHKLRKEKSQGLEKIFHLAFSDALDHPGWTAKNWVSRASFETTDKRRRKGWVDGVITHQDGHRIGVEFKVCQFPRMKWQSPNQSMYDIGQLAWDFGALKKYDLDFGVLHRRSSRRASRHAGGHGAGNCKVISQRDVHRFPVGAHLGPAQVFKAIGRSEVRNRNDQRNGLRKAVQQR